MINIWPGAQGCKREFCAIARNKALPSNKFDWPFDWNWTQNCCRNSSQNNKELHHAIQSTTAGKASDRRWLPLLVGRGEPEPNERIVRLVGQQLPSALVSQRFAAGGSRDHDLIIIIIIPRFGSVVCWWSAVMNSAGPVRRGSHLTSRCWPCVNHIFLFGAAVCIHDKFGQSRV